MDGTATDGRKSIPYLRDHFDVAALSALASSIDEMPADSGRDEHDELVTASA